MYFDLFMCDHAVRLLKLVVQTDCLVVVIVCHWELLNEPNHGKDEIFVGLPFVRFCGGQQR